MRAAPHAEGPSNKGTRAPALSAARPELMVDWTRCSPTWNTCDCKKTIPDLEFYRYGACLPGLREEVLSRFGELGKSLSVRHRSLTVAAL